MHSKARPATKAESTRIERMVSLGCMACRQGNQTGMSPQCHHLTECGRRRGHAFTITLCEWHHQGYPLPGLNNAQMTERYGPSLADGSRLFKAAFGGDDELLAAQNALIRKAYGVS